MKKWKISIWERLTFPCCKFSWIIMSLFKQEGEKDIYGICFMFIFEKSRRETNSSIKMERGSRRREEGLKKLKM